MTFFQKVILVAGLCSILLAATPAVAAPSWWPLVPCGVQFLDQGECTKCDLFKLVDNLIDFVFFGLAPVLGTIFFIWAGVQVLLAGANVVSIQKGKDIFWTTVKALLVIGFAWLITNTLIKSLGVDYDGSDKWYQFTCTDVEREPVPVGPVAELCNQPAELAKRYNEPYPAQNSEELNTLISCIKGRLPAGSNYGEESSFDKSKPLCNYTRGNRVCSSCSHSVNSCHYGGRTGNQGAMAIDFGNEDIGDAIIEAARACGAKNPRCETSGGVTVSCSNAAATHVHVNSKSCDAN
ncbi:MAG: hypothetical protein Q8P35_03390 [Candidatus Yanofskybacteria bacterium]|nr:hypothetical protein [Candidatus Yanofskybacteria bacterium]